ncbi:Transmembrane protein [Melia azedarach]|uniref:Transmembrane protein n=1 Tax=Melia azedarach TaxID=155640 RepID=A0ACC1WY53_MELAZ|nr:Transmembrane protein [Melia azedarach]
MDEYHKEQQELQAFDNHYFYFNKNHFLNRTFQLVLSVSIFSLILCYSSGFSFFPAHSFNVYFSTFLFSFFTRSLERKYMFLICNASGLPDMKSSAEEVEKKVHVTTVESFEHVALHQAGEKESSLGELEKEKESGAFVQEEAEEKEEDNESVGTPEDDIRTSRSRSSSSSSK